MFQFSTLDAENQMLRCHLLYPKDCSELFEDIISPFLQENFDLEYYHLCYEGINRESIQYIRNALENSSILLFAYVGEMTLEYSYKLGLAHAYDTHVVLINFQNDDFSGIPGCINFDFLVPVINLNEISDLDLLLSELRCILATYLSEDLVEFLYRKASSLCDELEKKASRMIARVDKATFSDRLVEDDIHACINNYDKSSRILLRKIVEDIKVLTIVLNSLNSVKKPLTSSSGISINIENKIEAHPMADQSKKIQNFNAPVGVVANDQAQVTNFTQINNANTAELLQLITTMRQTAAQFPQEIQDDIIIDLDDVETEIKKPEADRNIPKIKKRLLAILAAISVMATPIASTTDFINNAIDLGSKFGIELLPPAPQNKAPNPKP
jgi:hypothetical protein